MSNFRFYEIQVVTQYCVGGDIHTTWTVSAKAFKYQQLWCHKHHKNQSMNTSIHIF